MKEYYIGGRQVQLPKSNEYVAVCWNCKLEHKTMTNEDGLIFTANVPKQSGSPYIDFVSIRGEEDNLWIDEDIPVAGGLTLGFAKRISEELLTAIAHLETINSPPY